MHTANSFLVVGIPDELRPLLESFPVHFEPDRAKKGSYDFIQIYAMSQADLEQKAREVIGFGKYDCLFWACYPKLTGKIKSDIKRETVWEVFSLIGLEAVSQISINTTWSALRARPLQEIKTRT